MSALQSPLFDEAAMDAAHNPRSIAVIGASDNPHKIGGRPLAYLDRFGFAGPVYPINPSRPFVQGRTAYPSIADVPSCPDLAIIAVPGDDALDAVEACADRGVKIAVVMASGFAEIGDAGQRAERRMLEVARSACMRLVGPNTQGIANFATGAVASFATLFNEVTPADGGVAIVSQSGAMSVVPYALLRQRGIGVRYSHATGNEADLTVGDFAQAVIRDPEVKLVLLYMEAIANPGALATAAQSARDRDVPIVAVKAGRSAIGQATASSHTGALATEDRAVDAFFQAEGIYRVDDIRSLVNATELYLKGWRPRDNSFVAISNSGASCVMAADLAVRHGLEVAPLPELTAKKLRTQLPAFASARNPVDLTAALLTNNRLFGAILPELAGGGVGETMLISLPIAGQGYDTKTFAADTAAASAALNLAVVAAVPQDKIAKQFQDAGVPVFAHDSDAIAALGQLAAHVALMRRPRQSPKKIRKAVLPETNGAFLSEWHSIDVLRAHGVPFARSMLCYSANDAMRAADEIGGKVAVKACSAKLPHKAEYNLVELNVLGRDQVRAAFERLTARLEQIGIVAEGVIVAEMISSRRELLVGARNDPRFGTLVMIGDGGKYVEALKDTTLLRYPFAADDVADAMRQLFVGPILAGVRGELPYDLTAFGDIAATLGAVAYSNAEQILSIDINPVLARADGSFLAVDALIERKPQA